MKNQKEKLLEEFQNDYYRGLEEDFARTLAEDESVRLFFINEDQAFTDGVNVIVDPATHDLYKDEEALENITEVLRWDKSILSDPFQVLRITTRAQTVHECLHLLYSDFPLASTKDSLCNTRNKRTVMNLISNIIEDSYIEAVGCSVYDNLSFFLSYGRVSKLFAHKKVNGTAKRILSISEQEEKQEQLLQKAELTSKDKQDLEQITNLQILHSFIDYMAGLILYPFLKQPYPDKEISAYVQATKDDFFAGSRASSPDKRYAYCQKIFKIIAHLIPSDDIQLHSSNFIYLEGGEKTHQWNSSVSSKERKGREQEVKKSLFEEITSSRDEDDNSTDDKECENRVQKAKDIIFEQVRPEDETKLRGIIADFEEERLRFHKVREQQKSKIDVLDSLQLGASPIHNKIKVFEKHPAIEVSLRPAYQSIYRRYKSNINSYNNRFAQLLQAHVQHREEKYFFGKGITSSRLGDLKKRYWYRQVDGIDVPDLAVLVLVDGSGSMKGERQEAATNATLILHEVLATQHIPHAIVEHRAHGFDPEMEANVLLGFNPRPQGKLNIMRISARDGNRDGLALYWSAKYLTQQVSNEYKLIIMISDGCPAHAYDEYHGVVGKQDTIKAVKRLEKQGIHVVAIALDEAGSYECYNALSSIYPHLIHCDNLKRLTSSLLGIIAKLL